MNTIAVYPPGAPGAIIALTRHNNDIHIFVEDTCQSNFWPKLLKRFLLSADRCYHVTGLGGRGKVLESCKLHQTDDFLGLFIIDSDFDLLLEKSEPSLKHLHRLQAYCIENYLLQESMLLDLITTLASFSEADAQRKFSYGTWIDQNAVSLTRIFVCYALAEHFDLGICTVTYSVHRLLTANGSSDICRQKARKRSLAIYNQAKGKVGAKKARKKYRKIWRSAKSSNILTFVSGKNYLLPMVQNRVRRLFGIQLKKDQFIRLLAERVCSRIDTDLTTRLGELSKRS